MKTTHQPFEMLITYMEQDLGRIYSYQWKRFYASDQQTEIKMMSTIGEYNYYKATNLKIVEIPYAGISMIIFLPSDTNGLLMLLYQFKISPEGINFYVKHMKKTLLKLTIPKFRVATDLPMDEVYNEVGLKEIFQPENYVLTKIVRYNSVYVTGSYQSAVFEVDESGNDGGVANTMLLGKPDKDKDRSEFIANRPFLFFVVANGEQLLAGIYGGKQRPIDDNVGQKFSFVTLSNPER